jgi:hypothetical protein
MPANFHGLKRAFNAARRAMWPAGPARKEVNGFRGWGTHPKEVRAAAEWNCRCLKSTLMGLSSLIYAMVAYAVGPGPISSSFCAVAFGLALLYMRRSYFCVAQVTRIEKRIHQREVGRKHEANF